MKNNVRILIALMLAFSCSTAATNIDKLEAFLTQNNRNIEDYDVVMRISETGCVGCNKSFASLVKNYVKSRNNLFSVWSEIPQN